MGAWLLLTLMKVGLALEMTLSLSLVFPVITGIFTIFVPYSHYQLY